MSTSGEFIVELNEALIPFRQQEYGNAASMLECVAEKWNFPVSAVAPLVRSLVQIGNVRKAKERLRQGIRANPSSMRLLALRGDIWAVIEGELEKGIEIYRNALRCKECDLVEAGNIEYIRVRLASLLFRTGESEQGIRGVDEVLARAPERLIRKAALFCTDMFTVQEYGVAVVLFQKLLKQDPSCHHALCELAKAYLYLLRHDEAIQILRDAITHAPGEMSLYATLGGIYEELKCSDDAEAVYLQALQLNGDASPIRYRLSYMALAKGEEEKACAYFSPDNPAPEFAGQEIVRYAVIRNDVDLLDTFHLDEKWKRLFTYHMLNPAMRPVLYPGFNRFSEQTVQPALHLKNSAFVFIDAASPRANFIDGRRRVVNKPMHYTRSVHVFGPCTPHSALADECTVVSQLQQLLNERAKESVRVVDYSVQLIGDVGLQNYFLQFLDAELAEGDTVIFFHHPHTPITNAEKKYYQCICDMLVQKHIRFLCLLSPLAPWSGERSAREEALAETYLYDKNVVSRNKTVLFESGIVDLDLSRLFDRPHSMGEVFTDWSHVNHVGNKRIAEAICELILREKEQIPLNICESAGKKGEIEKIKTHAVCHLAKVVNKQVCGNRELATWLRKVKNGNFRARKDTGAIVMNCNPFTKGHLFLIEEALQRVKGLYVFVVEEERSVFPFADRFRLVQEGIRHVRERVTVIPSGQFIISNFTFPHYFSKEAVPIPVDSTNDLMIFGALIAPALNIGHRFVGDEPACVVTRSYNTQMLSLLPDMGIEVHVVPRVAGDDGVPISASTVRQAFREKDWPRIQTLTPACTYDFLSRVGEGR